MNTEQVNQIVHNSTRCARVIELGILVAVAVCTVLYVFN